MVEERLARRKRLWWKSKDARLHSKRYCHGLRDRNDPEELWKCCPYWQRKLANKWNAREWAQRHGARVPELYWHGRDVEAIPFESLPSHYVIRSTSGSNRKGVVPMADGQNVVDGLYYTVPEVKAKLTELLSGGFSETLLLVEEYVRDEQGRPEQPVDYKFLVFGDEIAAIMTVERKGPGAPGRTSDLGFYTADWKPIEGKMMTHFAMASVREPPACLDEMSEVARRLGRSYETFVRVDLYATDRGCVFGEFSPIPGGGTSHTPYGEKYLEAYWSRIFPDRL